MSEFSSGSAPGFQPLIEGQAEQITWNGRHGQDLAVTRPIVLAAGEVDADNTPATTIRGGTVMAIRTSDGKACVYDPDAVDGRQIAAGVLLQSQNMLVDGVSTDRFTYMLVHGLVKESQLHGLDPRARRQLAGSLVFDTAPLAAHALLAPIGVVPKAANYSVVAADNGLLLLATAAVTFTLPAPQNGLAFRFAQAANANLVVAGNSNLIHGGSIDASSVGFTTTDEKAGSQALVEAVYTAAGTLRWFLTNLGGTTATIT